MTRGEKGEMTDDGPFRLPKPKAAPPLIAVPQLLEGGTEGERSLLRSEKGMAALPRTEMFLSDGGKCRCHLGEDDKRQEARREIGRKGRKREGGVLRGTG